MCGMETGFYECYQQLSKKHSELIEAFDYYEKMHEGPTSVAKASAKYGELLTFWRNYLGLNNSVTDPCDVNDISEITILADLEAIEKELAQSYSPTEVSRSKILTYFDKLKSYLLIMDDDKIIQKKAAFLLCRLLYNILLLKECFFPIKELPYVDFLSNVRNLLNKCIVISQLDYFNEYFEEIVNDFNEDFVSVKEVTPHILNIVGVLNFKCHKYREAIGLFRKAILGYERLQVDELIKNDEYFQIKLLLAYCYEYNHDFELAINELIGLDVESLLSLCPEQKMYDLLDEKSFKESRNAAQDIIDKIKKASDNRNNNLLYLGTQRDNYKPDIIGDVHEVLHSLGHCLNELGIKEKMHGQKDRVVRLLYMARLIMLEVAEQNGECEDFQTCLYMLYGEAKDYDICLNRIQSISKKLKESKSKNVNLRMENLFYLFLVLNQANKVILSQDARDLADNAYSEFKEFAQRRYDYDALIHIEIIRFRSKIISILLTEGDDAKVSVELEKLKTEPEGVNMFGIKPSAKLNKWIVQEYNKTIALYEFLVKYYESEGTDVNNLYNFAWRFSFFRNLFENSIHSFSDNDDKISIIQKTISLIIDDVVSPQSIFLLAPLTSAVPYQHQTESLLSLENELFLISDNMPQKDDKLDQFQKLHEALKSLPKAESLKNWLFSHSEYFPIFIIMKNTPDIKCERFYYADNNGVVLERPIHNVERLNELFKKLGNKRPRKRHVPCANGQSKCCISVVDKSASKDIIVTHVKDICKELLIPIAAYEGRHFVIDYRYSLQPSTEWTILGFEQSLSKVHESEIIQYLCSNQKAPEYKLGVTLQDYCFIAFNKYDARIATSDILYLQEQGIHFWYNQTGEDISSLESRMLNSKFALFFLSPNTFQGTESETMSRLIKKIQRSTALKEKSIFITTNFTSDEELKVLLDKNWGDELVDYVMMRKVNRKSSDCDESDHLSNIVKSLLNNGVKQNDFLGN